MGVSDRFVIPFYDKHINKTGEVAYLGDPQKSDGDCYDLKLSNWEINSEWVLDKKYDTIVCTRVALFAKDPRDLLARCKASLRPGGVLYIDWELGEHLRPLGVPLKPFKVGWVKSNADQEWCYHPKNFGWSAYWDDAFNENPEVDKFREGIKTDYPDADLKKIIKEEIPSLISRAEVEEIFAVEEINFLYCAPVGPSLYCLLKCRA